MPEPGNPGPAGQGDRPAPHASTRAVLDEFALGNPEDPLRFGDLVSDLRQTAFGMLLFVAVLPAFLPLPGVAGALREPCPLPFVAPCRRPPRTTAGMRRPPPSTEPDHDTPSPHGRPARD